MVATGYMLLTAVGVYFILSIQVDRIRGLRQLMRFPQGYSKLGKRLGHLGIVMIALSLLIFPAWQLFSGSFFPAGYTGGLPGNGVPSIGTFTPSNPPAQMFEVYQWLMCQPGTFNVYWPGAEGSTYPWSLKATPSLTWVDSPRPSYVTTTTPSLIFPVGLRFLIANASSYDLADYLRALDLRYVVVQPTSQPAMITAWGIDNLTSLRAKFDNTAGMTLVHQSGDISVYEVSHLWGYTYSPDLVISYPFNDEDYTLAYGILGSLGATSAIVAHGSPTQLCFDISGCGISIYSAEFLANQMTPNLERTTPMGGGGTSTTIGLAAGTMYELPSPWYNWTLTNWGLGNSTISFTDNVTQWDFPSAATTLSLSYNGTVTNGNGGGIVVPLGDTATVQVGFWYKIDGQAINDLRVILPTLDNNQDFIADLTSPQLQSSDEWTYASFNYTLPDGTRFFTSRIQVTASSTAIEVKNVRLEVRFLSNDPNSPFGSLFDLPNNTPIQIGNNNGSLYIQYLGQGFLSLGGVNVTLPASPRVSWFAETHWSGARIQVAGNVSVATIVVADSPIVVNGVLGQEATPINTTDDGGPIVFARGFAPGYSLVDSSGNHFPISTIDGMNLFQNVRPGSYYVEFSSLFPMIMSYMLTLGLVSVMLLASAADVILQRRISSQLDDKERDPVDDGEASHREYS